jgi:mono/diheme cytochrome c family protein
VETILDGYNCTGCHGGSGSLNLTGYDNVTTDTGNNGLAVLGTAAESNLWTKLHNDTKTFGSRMPQGGGQVSDEDRQTIADWINGGAVETCP